jgi:hypothetical protein
MFIHNQQQSKLLNIKQTLCSLRETILSIKHSIIQGITTKNLKPPIELSLRNQNVELV